MNSHLATPPIRWHSTFYGILRITTTKVGETSTRQRTCLVVLAISRFARGFITNALIPAAFAFSASTRWLWPCAHDDRHVQSYGERLPREVNACHLRGLRRGACRRFLESMSRSADSPLQGIPRLLSRGTLKGNHRGHPKTAHQEASFSRRSGVFLATPSKERTSNLAVLREQGA